ncbi:DNA/RNA non-specific endonuclease [Prevotella sp.]
MYEEEWRNKGDQLNADDNRLPGDEEGHLIGKIFRGSGELDNLAAMDAIVNRSDYKVIENEWKNAL